VFELAAELVSFGVPVARLSRTLFEEHSFAYLKLLAAALERAVLVPELSFVWTAVRQQDLIEYGVTFEEVEGLIDVVRRTQEAEVAVVLKEGTDGITRVSMRSLGAVDVCRIAQSQGGGGHRFAAGFSTDEPIPETVRRIESALRE
jgi:phosphoesterase RecJ-like protein